MKLLYKIVIFSMLTAGLMHAYDNVHFYRATNLFPEPRLSKDFLSTFDFSAAVGFTRTSLNSDGKEVPLFDLWGPNNMHELGINVPCKDLTNPLDLILQQLSLTPSRDCFATFSIGGRFTVIEAIASYIQNFKRGIFIHFYLPIRHFEFKDIRFCDLSPTCGCPNINTPIWQSFLNNFDAILARYFLSRTPHTETGVGDLTIFLGWTHNYQDTTLLDFVDLTIKAGLLVPTGKKQNVNNIFSLPTGYNGHIGFDLSTDFAMGAFEWLTIGLHADGLIFADKTRFVRIKTAAAQSGIIKLAKAVAKVELGSIWHIGAYLKADHFVRGLSFLLGYSFAHKTNDEIKIPCSECFFNPSVANTDEMLQSYTMHTLHYFLEYDFSRENIIFCPRIAIFFNQVVGGKRIFKTNMFGGNFGFDLVWKF